MAKLLNMPEFMTTPDGRYAELMAFRHNQPIYYITDNANAAISTRANKVYAGGGAGLGLSGSGVTLGIWDGGGVMTNHQEVTGRVTIVDGAALHWHAGHVGGTMIGSGVVAAAKGMSFAGSLRSFDWTSDTSEMTTEAGAGLRVSNHSYGSISGWYFDGATQWWFGDTSISTTESPNFGFYDWDSFDWDVLAYNNPYYLQVKSAGNDRGEGPVTQPHQAWNGSSWVASSDPRAADGGATGYDTIPFSGVAKNILTVGAVEDVLSYTGPASVVMSTFSGWGPADDGRIKPDIVGNGVNVTSLYSPSGITGYATASGTSMSGPNVAGSLGLLIQHQRNLNSGQDMLGQALKALVIHTADEAGPNIGPDYMFGWGLMDTEHAANLITLDKTNTKTMTDHSINNGGSVSTTVYSDGTSPIKVTIAWADPPGTPMLYSLDPTNKMLVNDLDLRVVGPDAITYYPWYLMLFSPSAPASQGDNNVDNVEQVDVIAPMVGNYTITVTHKGSLYSGWPQNFSRVITGTTMPTAANNSYGVNAGGSLNIAAPGVLGNDTSASTAVLTQSPANAAAFSLNSNGSFTYTPNPTFAGTDTFKYRAVNATGSSAQATVTITVRNVLQSIVLNVPTIPGGSNATGTVTLTTPAKAGGQTVSFSDSQPWFFATGVSVLIPAGQTSAPFTIPTTPPPYSVTAKINCTLANGSGISMFAMLTIKPLPKAVNDSYNVNANSTLNPAAPGVLSNDINLLGGTAVLVTNPTRASSFTLNPNGSFSYTPNNNYQGNDSFTYKCQNAGGTGTIVATVSIYVRPVLGSIQNYVGTVTGGNPVTGTVHLVGNAPPGGVIVYFSDTLAALNTTSYTVTIPAGSSSTAFSIPTTAVGTQQTGTVTATLSNGSGVTKTKTVTINP